MHITVEQFDNFWNSKCQYMGLRNSERLRCNLQNKIAEFGESELLDEYVLTLRSGKESTRKLIVKFYEYLEENYSKPESSLYDKRFYDYPFERQLEIAKYLHERKSPAEIREHFDIDERTMRQDLQALEDGITVLGSTIQIQKEKDGKKYYYRTTLHPVFLPLNLTEVYALTIYLDRAIRDNDANATIIRDISARVKSQLSDYALGKLFPDDANSVSANTYIDDEELAHQRHGILMYLMKSGRPCRFFWKDEEYEGAVVYQNGKYIIRLTDGSILDADINEVDFIIDSLEYK